MKRLLLLLAALSLCALAVACDEFLVGIGDETAPITSDPQPYIGVSTEVTRQAESQPLPQSGTDMEWKNFVLVRGAMYSSIYRDTTVDVSQIGEKLGEITYRMSAAPGTPEAQQEYAKAQDGGEFAAAYRDVGCGVYSVIGNDSAIAVLDGGIYYLYTLEG